MIERPRFSPLLDVECPDGGSVFLLSERRQRLVTGGLAGLVCPLIDGQRSADEIAELLEGQAPAVEVFYALVVLERDGYLVESTDSAEAARSAFWQALGVGHAGDRDPVGRVSIVTLGGISPDALAEAFASLDVAMVDGAELTVVLTDDYLQPALQALNSEAVKAARPWILCKPVGSILWLGPLFQPGRSGCWECLAARLRSNRPIESYLRARTGRSAPIVVPQPILPTSMQAGLSLVATEAARWLATGQSALDGALITLDLATVSSERHALAKRPQCTCCGDTKYRRQLPSVPVVPQRRSKEKVADGGRSASPEATLRRFDHHASGLTGAVGPLQRVSEDDDPVSVYAAESNALHRPDGDAASLRDLRHLSAGKGRTDAQARASALCEALERHSGRFQGYEPRRRACYGELAEEAVHPNACMLFSDRQFLERAAWNARGSRVQFVPEPFDEGCDLDWSPVWSLTNSRWRYLPAEYCYYDYPSQDKRVFCRADSNGCAAGNNLEEAILQGFFELVERDAVAIWWYNRLQRPSLDLDSFADPYIAGLGRYYRGLDRELWVLDVTSDLDIPAFAAVSRRLTGGSENLIMGFGAHLDARTGVLHALTEMNQFLVATRRLANTDAREPVFLDRDFHRWLKTATLAEQPYLAPDASLPPRAASMYGSVLGDDLFDDLQCCEQIVERHGMELLVLDQTRPDIGLPVAKVIVPGLRPWRPRFAPGRLYDVPVNLGWLERPSAETSLNLVPMFL